MVKRSASTRCVGSARYHSQFTITIYHFHGAALVIARDLREH